MPTMRLPDPLPMRTIADEALAYLRAVDTFRAEGLTVSHRPESLEALTRIYNAPERSHNA